jgi:hypothetical protein
VSKIVGAQWYLHEVLQLQGHNRVLLRGRFEMWMQRRAKYVP